MKNALILLATVWSLFSGNTPTVAQTPTITAYRASTIGSTQQVIAIYSDGSRKAIANLPTDAVLGRKGGIVRLPYATEAKRVFNPQQFGTGKYYSPTFAFSIDFNPGPRTPVERKALGVNRFTQWAVSPAEKEALPYGDGMLYLTESSFNYEYEGARYYESSLAEYEQKLWSTFPSLGVGVNQMFKYLIFNIETSNDWHRNYYVGSQFWPSWESVKNHTVVCESDGVTRTLEQIDNQNLWSQEAAVRRANRLLIAFKIARVKGAADLKISYGASMYQGLPRVDFADNSHGIFQPGAAGVNNIGGSNNTITLNTRTYSGMTGDQWSQEDFMTGYYYLFNFDISRSDYNDIWVNKLSGTQTYPYLWSKIKIRHIVADEKGYLQLNRKRQLLKQGSKRGILRMQEPVYEADGAGVVDNTYINDQGEAKRIPFAELQTNVTGKDAPKIYQPPYLNYSRYCVTRFFAGNEPGWGFYLFPTDVVKVRLDLNSEPVYNHHLHSITAIHQARADMQPYEKFYSGSTLVEDPDVQLNGSGAFSAYDGTTAYNYNDGVTGTQKPAYMLRYKAQSDGSTRVVILGGMNQGWTSERIDVVRVPNGGLNGNSFRVKLRGPAAQVYEFSVRSGDSNQVYEALPNANTSWEQPGYAGRVGNQATTPPPSTTTTPPPSNTAPISTLAGGYGEGTATGLFAYAPFVPTTNQYPSWPYGGATRQYLQNQFIKAGFMKGLGGTLDYLSEVNGSNLLNNNASGGAQVEGQTVPENGRQAGVAVYATPIPYSQDGQVSGPIGWNGVVGGSIYQDKSVILHYERRTVTGYGEVLYFKTQPQQWEMHNILTKCYVHSFYWLEGRTIRYFYILENFRDDNTMTFDGRGQELPFAYVTAPHYRYFVYTGNSPGTSGALTQINKPQPVEGGGSDNQNDTGEYNSTENWIGAVNTSDQGLFIVTPYNSRFNGKQFQSWYGDENSNASAYIGAASTMNFDLAGTAQAFTGYLYVGGMSDFRTWYNSANITGRPFSFTFSAHKTAGWYGASKFNSSDQYEFNIGRKHDGNPNSAINSPWGVWKASEMPTLFVKGKFSGVSSISLEWTRPNETEIQSAANQKTVTVINDGAEHTYTISMSGTTNWSGIITKLKIGNPYNYSNNTFPSVPDSATFVPSYIGTTNPN